MYRQPNEFRPSEDECFNDMRGDVLGGLLEVFLGCSLPLRIGRWP